MEHYAKFGADMALNFAIHHRQKEMKWKKLLCKNNCIHSQCHMADWCNRLAEM
jgi:hypothetical protein